MWWKWPAFYNLFLCEVGLHGPPDGCVCEVVEVEEFSVLLGCVDFLCDLVLRFVLIRLIRLTGSDWVSRMRVRLAGQDE